MTGGWEEVSMLSSGFGLKNIADSNYQGSKTLIMKSVGGKRI